jgi:tRNA A-37 threonylcarbamoyl transferase component Bud32
VSTVQHDRDGIYGGQYLRPPNVHAVDEVHATVRMAVERLHASELVHGDIQHSNILIVDGNGPS